MISTHLQYTASSHTHFLSSSLSWCSSHLSLPARLQLKCTVEAKLAVVQRQWPETLIRAPETLIDARRSWLPWPLALCMRPRPSSTASMVARPLALHRRAAATVCLRRAGDRNSSPSHQRPCPPAPRKRPRPCSTSPTATQSPAPQGGCTSCSST